MPSACQDGEDHDVVVVAAGGAVERAAAGDESPVAEVEAERVRRVLDGSAIVAEPPDAAAAGLGEADAGRASNGHHGPGCVRSYATSAW